MEKKYYLTEEQFREIIYFKQMFELSAERIENLCAEEKSDIIYGFELGKLHNDVRMFFMKMMEFESEIFKQKLEK